MKCKKVLWIRWCEYERILRSGAKTVKDIVFFVLTTKAEFLDHPGVPMLSMKALNNY